MLGPFEVGVVDFNIEPYRIGAYILTKNGRTAHYVGRSDDNLRERIKTSSHERRSVNSPYTHFWFAYALSPDTAYRLECEWYHKYGPTDNMVHPACPAGRYIPCPVCGQ